MTPQPMTIRVHPALYARLRRKAFDDRRAMNDLIGEAIAARLRLSDGKAAEVLQGVLAEGLGFADLCPPDD